MSRHFRVISDSISFIERRFPGEIMNMFYDDILKVFDTVDCVTPVLPNNIHTEMIELWGTKVA